MTELAKHIAQRVMQSLFADPAHKTYSIAQVAEIIDSAGVRELTEQHKMDQFWNEEARQVSVRHAKDLEDLTERVRELTEALQKTLVIARQALVYFNTESGREAMKELEKIEARIKGEK